MGRGGNWRRRAAAAKAGGKLRSGSPEARLQAAFVRIARGDIFYRKQVSEVYEKNAPTLMEIARAEEAKASDLHKRRLAAFDRFTTPGDPEEEQIDRRTRQQGSELFSLLVEFSELLDDFQPLSREEMVCAGELPRLLTEMAQTPARFPADQPPEPIPELTDAESRLEQIAQAFAAIDAKQAVVLADPALTAADQQARLTELAARQNDFCDRLFMGEDG